MANDDSDYMLLLPYTPREDSASRGYEQWLRDVDNPFFNSVPGVVHYGNWRVDRPTPAVPYTHFDFLRVANPGQAGVDEVWGNTELAEFAANWTLSWGRYPDADAGTMRENYHVYRCERRAGSRPRGRWVAYVPCTARPQPIPHGAELWEIDEALVGDARFGWLLVVPLAAAGDFEAVAASLPDAAVGAALGEIVAAPDMH